MRKLLLLVSFLFVCNCHSNISDSNSTTLSKVENNLSEYAAFEEEWKQYTSEVEEIPYKLQERCHPLFYKPKGKVKGVALFYHGFTACPMQFIPFAKMMSENGYYVIIPLLPGQGRSPTPMNPKMMMANKSGFPVGLGEYYGKYLPTQKEPYIKLSRRMNSIIEKAPGKKVVGGLSVGGALTILSYVESPTLYDHALSLSPHLGMPGLYWGYAPKPWYNKLLKPLSDLIYHAQIFTTNSVEKVKLLGKIPISFGRECYESIRGDRMGPNPRLNVSGGRDAICDFQLKHLYATQKLGEYIQKKHKKLIENNKITTKVQIAAVEFDSAADTNPIKKISQNSMEASPEQFSLCFYGDHNGEKIGHVIFDDTEDPFSSMSWRKSFMEQSEKFLLNGTLFESSIDSDESGFKRCSIY